MKVFINNPKENWIVDRFRKEWIQFSLHKNVIHPFFSDLIWIIAPWTWNRINTKLLSRKKVICTIHHIDFEKFDKIESENFKNRDKYVDIYHSISSNTTKQLKELTEKKIVEIPFWVNENNFFSITNKESVKDKFNISKSEYLIGSFQRDTEGSDLISPKLSKGPDLFMKAVLQYQEKYKDLAVILTGKRRQYIIKELERENVKFYYFPMVSLTELNELYNILDLYIVSSRIEGGPQAIMECAASKTNIISTDVGVASQILHHESIIKDSEFLNAKPHIEYAFEKVKKFYLNEGIKNFERNLIN